MNPSAVAAPPASAPVKSRLLYIDNLRFVLISLVVVGHLAITYSGVGDWYYKEQGAKSDLFTNLAIPIGALLMAFLLGLFSMIAGYFTAPAYDRKGAAGFVLDRLKRLAIPWAFYEAVLHPLIRYVVEARLGYPGTLGDYLRAHFSSLRSFGAGPVWFLEMLLIFSLVYAAVRLLSAALRRGASGPAAEASPGRRVPGNGAIALFALGLGVATWIIRIWFPSGKILEPWHQEPARYPQYVALFVIGLMAYRGDWLARFPEAQARLWRRLIPLVLIAFVGVAAAGGAFAGKLDERAAGGLNWRSLVYSMWEAWVCIAVSIALPAWFRRRFNRQGRWAKALSDAAFGVYVLHPAVIVPLAVALGGIGMNLGLKFLWVAPIGLALCFLIVHLLRKAPGMKRFL